LKFCTLFSGSSGNSTYISDGCTDILVDAGVAGSRIESALSSIGANINNIKGIFITHEHSDHITGVGVLSRRYNIPIFANSKTMASMEKLGILKKIPAENIRVIDLTPVKIGNIEITAYPISHDASCPCGYLVTRNNVKEFAITTDTGVVTEAIAKAVTGTKTIVLESNHDISMLEFGPYPFVLKQRIKSELGHLSNDDAAKFAVYLARNGTSNIILGHLSHENNYPDLAYQTVNALFRKNDIQGVNILVAPRSEPGKMMEVE